MFKRIGCFTFFWCLLFIVTIYTSFTARPCAAETTAVEELFTVGKYPNFYKVTYAKLPQEQQEKMLHYFKWAQQNGVKNDKLEVLSKNLLHFYRQRYSEGEKSPSDNVILLSAEIREVIPQFENVRAETPERRAIKKEQDAKAAQEASKKFIKLGNCEVGETVYHREAWNSKTSSGNFLADALFNASVKEDFIIEFEGIVKGILGKKVEVYLQDYSFKQTKGGGILQPATGASDTLIKYANSRIGKSHFFEKSRCGN